MKIHFFSFLTLLFWLSCTGETDTKNSNHPKVASKFAKQETKPETAHDSLARNLKVNQVARFLSAQKQYDSSDLSSLESGNDWKLYQNDFDSLWEVLDRNRLEKQRSWVKTNMKEIVPQVKTLFYPFSGADFLNANIFFPDAEKTIMIGLEPPGSLPNLNRIAADSLDRYFATIRKSLYSIVKFSFYQTKHMAKDFRNDALDGTLPNILIFLSRNGNDILNIEPVAILPSGKLVVKKFADYKKKNYKGLKITYSPSQSNSIREITYFSGDISNLGFSQDSGFYNYLQKLSFDGVFLKSASFLMHKDYFSGIRNIILRGARFVLQDDSGVPFRFFSKNQWGTRVFGSYDRPIKLFSNFYQKDFHAAYADSSKVGKLTFGIGYDWKPNQSNLMLASKKMAKK